MKKLLIPLILALLGTGAGVGAGIFLAEPEAPDDESQATDNEAAADKIDESGEIGDFAKDGPALIDDGKGGTISTAEYAELANQFVIPVIKDEQIVAMVVLSASIAVSPGKTDSVYAVEPRLRDQMLQVMFNHANVGGFSGNFTSTSNMRNLRRDLVRSAQNVLGDTVKDVLILDLVRQDI